MHNQVCKFMPFAGLILFVASIVGNGVDKAYDKARAKDFNSKYLHRIIRACSVPPEGGTTNTHIGKIA
jgi:hypothetical protein